MSLKLFGMEPVLDEQRLDHDGEPYRATKWECEGHEIDVNIDCFAYHVKIDGDDQKMGVNLDKGGLFAFIYRFFGRR